MESILKEAIQPVFQWLVQLGLPGVITIFSFVFVISLIKSTWFIDFMKHCFSSEARKMDRLNESIELLSDDAVLQGLLKKERVSLILQREYGANLTNGEVNIIKSIVNKVGDKFTLYKIVKAVKHYAGEEADHNLLRDFTIWDRVNYLLPNIFGLFTLITALFILIAAYFSLIFPEWQLLSSGEHKHTMIIYFGVIFSCFLMMMGGILVASVGWPFRYASDIKKSIIELDQVNKTDDKSLKSDD